MSESQLSRLEEALESFKVAKEDMTQMKNWFRNSAVMFAIATFVMIGSIALNNYRLNKVESDIPLLASKKGVELLEQVHTMEMNASLALLDSTKRVDMKKVYAEGEIIKSQIFVYGMGITRGGRVGSSQ
jgi:hypothetical protein